MFLWCAAPVRTFQVKHGLAVNAGVNSLRRAALDYICGAKLFSGLSQRRAAAAAAVVNSGRYGSEDGRVHSAIVQQRKIKEAETGKRRRGDADGLLFFFLYSV